jgi:hypothetical protein
MAGKEDQSTFSSVAQAVSESLLGRNAAGFSTAMKERFKVPDATSGDRKDIKPSGRNAATGNSRPAGTSVGRSAGANDIRPTRKDIRGATGNQEAQQARTGGKVRKSGRVKLHRGEVVRAKQRRGRNR